MDRQQLQSLLESVHKGDTAPDEALERLARLPYVDTPHARVDTHRAIRHGNVLRCPDCARPARLTEGDEIVLDRIELEVD